MNLDFPASIPLAHVGPDHLRAQRSSANRQRSHRPMHRTARTLRYAAACLVQQLRQGRAAGEFPLPFVQRAIYSGPRLSRTRQLEPSHLDAAPSLRVFSASSANTNSHGASPSAAANSCSVSNAFHSSVVPPLLASCFWIDFGMQLGNLVSLFTTWVASTIRYISSAFVTNLLRIPAPLQRQSGRGPSRESE
jgi:hypothetical protein